MKCLSKFLESNKISVTKFLKGMIEFCWNLLS